MTLLLSASNTVPQLNLPLRVPNLERDISEVLEARYHDEEPSK